MSAPSSADMEYYYSQLFPFSDIFYWLNHSREPSLDMANRELAMAFRSGAYKRYNSYTTPEEFKQQIERANPDRFEIGAVYNKPPKERDALLKSEMHPLHKELVFDIDMDDYDPYRTCCEGARVCTRCWRFITLAIEVMDSTLKEDFGFRDIMWVFSGRRGAHCWISDRRARMLTDIQRRNILDYVNVVRDRTGNKRLNLVRPYHPQLSRALEQLKPHFVDIILGDQDPWRNNDSAFGTLITGLHDKSLQEALRKHWTENPDRSSQQKWADIDAFAAAETRNNHSNASRKQDYMNKLKECKEDIVLQALYPKLDVEVTKQTIHLLKSPFCIHPATGNVCVPILDGFEPNQAPKLHQLQEEMQKHGNNVKETALQPFISHFETYIDTLIQHTEDDNSLKRKREEVLA